MKLKTIKSILYTCIVALAFTACKSESETPKASDLVVKTTNGEIKGSLNDNVYAYKGIPYARAERFMPPKAPESWDEVRETTEFGPVARQVVPWYPDSVQSEKELFSLNVWTRGIKDTKKRPVLVWLHGGGFFVGASNDPMTYGEALAKKGDIVVVSVNHRLNILGFLDLSAYGDQYAQSANVGMLDIVKALEWTKENIASFGGDPNDVTIVGESGGGGKVGTLMCMPAAKGLFNKAIIQSGTLINSMTQEKSQALAAKVLQKLNIAPEELKKLDTLDYKALVKAGNEAVAEMGGARTPGSAGMFGFAPSADGEVLLQQPFSPGFADISKDIPVMIGSTLNELMPVSYGNKALTLEQAKDSLTRQYGDQTDRYVELYAKAYPDYTPQDLLSIDKTFRPYTIRTADARAEESTAPVYAYILTWKSPVEDYSKGSFHGLDIPLAFNTVDLRPDWTGESEEAWALADKMSSAWINFVKTANPNVPGVLPKWEPYTAENGATMYFDNDCKIVYNHDRELMQFIRPLE
ncbi:MULTISPECIES: carboxylesterase/lipase family protein [unclassified Leeuwenhoekiella]|uniref:carboxylesterase/lipase family protein n=1 Tax=unclassified Leeuwenhoekiella TaxID=2615029 RepID=UPI000C67685E|nr:MULTISPECIES: carboxylesterase family protein [unclassified Leeuwenhoekiella]MAW95146.1 carboxylesterase [Leeuwenhoekiella sp.]|tara:strand:+ start:5266 stop:6834 length:1569 start_codon:yes stop_codon:yes gene_type:complete